MADHDDVSERLAAIVAALAPLAEQPSLRDELINAWRADECERFQAAAESMPHPDYVPVRSWCLLICEVVGSAHRKHEVEVYSWAASGDRLTDEELETLRAAVNPATGQSALDFLLQVGAIVRSTEFEHPLLEELPLEKCSVMCFGDDGGIRPKPPVS